MKTRKLTKKRLRAELEDQIRSCGGDLWPADGLKAVIHYLVDHYYPGTQPWSVQESVSMMDPHGPATYDVQRGFDDMLQVYKTSDRVCADGIAQVLNRMEEG